MDVRGCARGVHGEHACRLLVDITLTCYVPFVQAPSSNDRESSASASRIKCEYEGTHVREAAVSVVQLPQLSHRE
eukprot:6186179-Pleurochrysis_carterae.AAC.1